MRQPENHSVLNEIHANTETKQPTDIQLTAEIASGVVDHAEASASSATQSHAPEEESCNTEHDAFLMAMEHHLPLGYFWNPADSRIYKEDEGKEPVPLCGPIHIARYLRTPEGEDWSWEVEFLDRDKKLRNEIISIVEANTSPSGIGNRLTNRGFHLLAKGPDLCQFLAALHVEDRGLIVTQSGWVETPNNKGTKANAYVQPDGTIQLARVATDLSINFSGTKSGDGKAGSLEGWQKGVAKLALGNPALLFSVCVALSGPMLRFSAIDTLGFNLVAKKNSGKTHALKVAASCGNNPDSILRWNCTSAEMASVTAAANDRSLILDEFPLNPGNEVSETLYSIGNGTGKVLANRKVEHWRVALLSTSEKPLPEMFAPSRRTMPEGFSMRLLDIPARSWTYGIIDDLHGCSDSNTFLLALSRACRENHGYVLPHFVDIILRANDKFANQFHDILVYYRSVILKELGLSEMTASGQIQGVIERFALVAAVGEIAIFKGVLPWPRHTAGTATTDIARLWYEAFNARLPRGTAEPTSDLCAYVAKNIEKFIDLEIEQDIDVEIDFGWKDSTFIYLRSEALNDYIWTGDHVRAVAHQLHCAGILARGSEARSLQYRMPESLVRCRPRVYRLRRAAIAKGV